ncbi:MAG: hypothetical protein Q9191_007370 [Dirinaria sp. TL-2023a]
MDGDSSTLSKAFRERDNELYGKGNFSEALKAYRDAVRHDPSSPLPRSNISALSFEIGQYAACVQWATSALSRVEEKDTALRSRLASRTIKAHMHLKEFAQGRELLQSLSPDSLEKSTLESTLNREEGRTLVDHKTAWISLMELGRYRPALDVTREYFNFGHDRMVSQFDERLHSEEQMNCNFFFGGVGDARHVYATLIDIFDRETMSKLSVPSTKHYHFTMNDVKIQTAARNLIMLWLLQDLTAVPEASSTAELTMTTIFHVFCSHVMPGVIFEHMQKVITALIEELNIESPMLRKPYGVYVSQSHKAGLKTALKLWQDPYLGTRGIADVIKCNLSCLKGEHDNAAAFGLPDHRPQPCPREYAIFQRTGAVCGSSRILQEHEQQFQSLVLQYEQSGELPGKQLAACVKKRFKLNVTIIDPEWERERQDQHAVLEYLCFDPFDATKGQQFPESLFHGEKTPTKLYHWFAAFFTKVATAI